MTVIIHGDDTAGTTRKLDEYLRSPWVVRIDGKKTSVDQIQKSFQTDSLFSEKRTIIIENIKAAHKSIQDVTIELCNTTDQIIVFYHTDILDARLIKKFKNPQVFEYKLPKVYFQFLDMIVPGNAKPAHEMLETLLKTYTAEQVFYSLVKRFRLLLMLATGNASSFDDITKMSDWQLVKLRKQVSAWDREHLIRVYKKLFELEKGLKTSTLTTTLQSHIDILLMSEL